MKYFLILLYFSTTLLASNINSSLLKIHSTLAPKLLLMDYDLKKKIDNDTIIITIFYNQNDYKSAKVLEHDIETKYKDGLSIYSISIDLILYSEKNIDSLTSNLYYFFPANKNDIQKVLKVAKKSKALTFSYNEDDLKYGVMSSVLIAAKVKPILNLDAIKSNDITFRPVLLKISKIYKKQGI